MELLQSVDAAQVQDLQKEGAANGMADELCGAGMEKARANEVGMVLLAEVAMVLPAELGMVLLTLVNPVNRASAG